MQIIRANDLRWSDIVRPGDTVMWGQACGEPATLAPSLLAARAEIGGRFGVFLVTSYSGVLKPEHVDVIDFSGLVGTAGVRPLSRAGLIDIVPIQYSRLEQLIESGRIPCDVAIVQVSRPDESGRMSPGTINDYIRAAMRRARIVVAEINARVPWTPCDDPILPADIQLAVETDCPLVAVPGAPIGDMERRIARNVAAFVPDGAVIQPGIGALPDAIIDELRDRRDLGVHAGMIGDAIVELMERGAITNALKEIDRGVTVAGTMIGSERLFRYAHRNPAIRIAPPNYTHAISVISRLSRFVSFNAAVEVDLTGQVNAEAIGSDYVGTIGGQVDYVRAAAASPGGRSIIALPSTSHAGSRSRIAARLSGPVTTLRTDIDVIVTEWGAAELAGRSMRARVDAMIAIAHPDFREELARTIHAGARRQ